MTYSHLISPASALPWTCEFKVVISFYDESNKQVSKCATFACQMLHISRKQDIERRVEHTQAQYAGRATKEA